MHMAERPYVLIVDDQLVNRVVLGAVCKSMGFESVSVCDGLQALQELRRYVFVLHASRSSLSCHKAT